MHTFSLGLEVVLFVVAAVTYLVLIRSRHDASITTSILAR
jgi:high-affinity Fe2+/Pb2+ permease